MTEPTESKHKENRHVRQNRCSTPTNGKRSHGNELRNMSPSASSYQLHGQIKPDLNAFNSTEQSTIVQIGNVANKSRNIHLEQSVYKDCSNETIACHLHC